MTEPTKILVRGFHIDVHGHVNNARYLEFLEEARWDFYQRHVESKEFLDRGLVFSVVNVNINYRLPAYFGETLLVDCVVKEIRHRSLRLTQTVKREGDHQLLAEAEIAFVLVDPALGRAIPIEGKLRKTLEDLQVG